MSESPPASWYDPPCGHRPECNCSKCHSWHVEDCGVRENAEGPDYQCCKDQLELWEEKDMEKYSFEITIEEINNGYLVKAGVYPNFERSYRETKGAALSLVAQILNKEMDRELNHFRHIEEAI